jgi:hypothetical protein
MSAFPAFRDGKQHDVGRQTGSSALPVVSK